MKMMKRMMLGAAVVALGLTAFGATNVPYLDYNATTGAFEAKTCASCTEVTSETTAFADGGWYVVNSEVVISGHNIVVSGSAHLILCDGASLTISEGGDAAINVPQGTALTIYGQTEGTGSLHVDGHMSGAGIGGNKSCGNGSITINGGTVWAKGGGTAAGIGTGKDVAYDSSNFCDPIVINGGTVSAYGNGNNTAGIGTGYAYNCTGGVIRITGGNVTAAGGSNAAGIGGSWYCTGGDIQISGGTVVATGGVGIGGGKARGCLSLRVDGGTVKAGMTSPLNSSGAAVYCVTVDMADAVTNANGTVTVSGLEGYGVRDIRPIGGKLYLYLPNGNHQFTAGGMAFAATVNGAATTAVARGFPYLDYDATTGTFTEEICANYTKVTGETSTFADGGWYVVNGTVARTGQIAVGGSAHLILCDGASLKISGVGGSSAGILVEKGKALAIYGQTVGTGALTVTGGSNSGAGIGGNYYGTTGAITINGGTVTANGGGGSAAGIGSGWMPDEQSIVDPFDPIVINGGTVFANGSGEGAGIGTGYAYNWTSGVIRVTGGRVTAQGGKNAAAIGGGHYCTGGNIQITGGTVSAKAGSNKSSSIGGGENRYCLSTVIDGGSVSVNKAMSIAPLNSSAAAVYCVTVDVPAGAENPDGTVTVEGLEGYGLRDIYPQNGQLYLYLPNGEHRFAVDGTPFAAFVKDAATTAVNVYTVTLDAQGGEGGTPSVAAPYGQPMPTATMPTKDGYAFLGYFDANGKKYYNADGTSAANWDKTAATTLYAQWVAEGAEGNPWSVGGDVVAYTNGTGGLVVSGTGAAGNFSKQSPAPWAAFADQIKSVTIADGVESIGSRFFKGCTRIGTVTGGKNLVSVGENAFYQCMSLETIQLDNADVLETLKNAIVYQTAIKADGSLYTIPSITLPGYKSVLYGTNDLTDPDSWQPVDSDKTMQESGYHFFKFVLEAVK